MLLHQLVTQQAQHNPLAQALYYQEQTLSYQALQQEIQRISQLLLANGLNKQDRVGIYLEKRFETVISFFASTQAGGVFVPINPLLKAAQVKHILNDCQVHTLITSAERLNTLTEVLPTVPELKNIIVVGNSQVNALHTQINWCDTSNITYPPHRVIEQDMACIIYTSGSTGQPKGVVCSHRNLIAGAESVTSYLHNHANDRILCVLPLSFDYGLNQVISACYVGASAVLINHLFPRDIVKAVEKYAITGLAAVPPLWIQLSQLEWKNTTLRYLTNSGGHLPSNIVSKLRQKLPDSQLYLMYGLTEAFRSTYLPPEQIEQRPNSIGKAIPNAEILVLHPDGSPCQTGEIGELVHRGAHVTLGYWNDPERSTQRFKPLTTQAALPFTERVVWSGDLVKQDEEGYLYFVSRNDEMIKTSGYRVSPNEIEELIYQSQLVTEAVALGLAHPELGQAILLIAYETSDQDSLEQELSRLCKQQLPNYMQPSKIIISAQKLPRNNNGKIDRSQLKQHYQNLFDAT